MSEFSMDVMQGRLLNRNETHIIFFSVVSGEAASTTIASTISFYSMLVRMGLSTPLESED